MIDVLICVAIKGVSICSVSLGRDVPIGYVNVGRHVCPDCVPAALTEVFRGKRDCVIAINGRVIASARAVKGSEKDTDVSDFFDVMIDDGVLMFTLPSVRGSRREIAAEIRQCVVEKT
jgi:hypothetical protein